MSAATRTGELSQFLKSRRAQLNPAALGLPDDKRRVPGLKREELAALAGISREYYVRLEQGRGHKIASQVIESLARALGLGDDERAYFHRLASPPLAAAASASSPGWD